VASKEQASRAADGCESKGGRDGENALSKGEQQQGRSGESAVKRTMRNNNNFLRLACGPRLCAPNTAVTARTPAAFSPRSLRGGNGWHGTHFAHVRTCVYACCCR
jgi:hypothetical protein